MRRSPRKLFFFLLLATLIHLEIGFADSPAEAPTPTPSAGSASPLAATVDTTEISLAELDRVVAAQPAFGFYKSVSGDKIDDSMIN